MDNIEKSLLNKLDDIEDVLMDTERLQGGSKQTVMRNAVAKVQKIWDILYEETPSERI